MLTRKWITGGLILLALVALCGWAFQVEAWARAGGGRSMGSRGSRSAAPPKPYTAPSPAQPSKPSPTVTPTTPPPRPVTPPSQPSSFWRSFGGGLLGGLAGGLLFRSLFGGPPAYGGVGGLGGTGIGLFDIILLAGIGYLVYRYVKKRRESEALYQSSAGTVEMPTPAPYPPVYDTPQAQLQERDLELEKGLGYIRQFDPSFNEAGFQDLCMDTFFKVQGAYANRDMTPVRKLLSDEMYHLFKEEVERMKAEGRTNRLENVAVRSVDLTEVWQESGLDFITVRIYANLLDYVVEDTTSQVMQGSNTEPVKFEEYWTFGRPVGNNPWQLTAINQPS